MSLLCPNRDTRQGSMLSKQGSEGKTFKISPSRGILSSGHLQGITLIAQKPETTDKWPQQPQRHLLAIITWGLLHPKWHGRGSAMSVPGCSQLLMGPPHPCCVCEQDVSLSQLSRFCVCSSLYPWHLGTLLRTGSFLSVDHLNVSKCRSLPSGPGLWKYLS